MAVNAPGTQLTQEKVPFQEDSDSNCQLPIKSAFNYMPLSDSFEGFKKKSDMFCNSLCFLYINEQINATDIKQRKVSCQ